MKPLNKIFAISVMSGAAALSGCASMGGGFGSRGTYRAGGAAIGGIIASSIARHNPYAVMGGAILGGAIGDRLAPECTVRQTTVKTRDDQGRITENVREITTCQQDQRRMRRLPEVQ